MDNNSFTWQVTASDSLMDSIKALGDIPGKIMGALGGPFTSALKAFVDGTMLKNMLAFNAEMRKLGNQMGYTTTQSRALEKSAYNISKSLGTSVEQSQKLVKQLMNLRMSARDIESMGKHMTMFSEVTGASAEATGDFIGNLMKLGMSSASGKSILTGLANIQNKMGLTASGMESAVKTSSKLGSNLQALGARTSMVDSMTKATGKLASTFEQVGLNADEAGQLLEKIFSVDNFSDNIALMNKLGISAQNYSDILSGNAGMQQDFNMRLVGLGKEVKEMMRYSPIAASNYAKIWGMSAEQLIKLANAKDASVKKDRDMMSMWGSTTGTAAASYNKLMGSIQSFFQGLMFKAGPTIEKIVNKLTLFFSKVDWKGIERLFDGLLNWITGGLDILFGSNPGEIFNYVFAGMSKAVSWFVATILPKVIGFLQKIPWGSILKGLWSGVTGLMGTVWSSLDKTPFGGIIKSIAVGFAIYQGLMAANTIAMGVLTAAIVGNTVIQGGKSLVGAIGPMLSGILPALVPIALPLIIGLIAAALIGTVAFVVWKNSVDGLRTDLRSNTKQLKDLSGSFSFSGVQEKKASFLSQEQALAQSAVSEMDSDKGNTGKVVQNFNTERFLLVNSLVENTKATIKNTESLIKKNEEIIDSLMKKDEFKNDVDMKLLVQRYKNGDMIGTEEVTNMQDQQRRFSELASKKVKSKEDWAALLRLGQEVGLPKSSLTQFSALASNPDLYSGGYGDLLADMASRDQMMGIGAKIGGRKEIVDALMTSAEAKDGVARLKNFEDFLKTKLTGLSEAQIREIAKGATGGGFSWDNKGGSSGGLGGSSEDKKMGNQGEVWGVDSSGRFEVTKKSGNTQLEVTKNIYDLLARIESHSEKRTDVATKAAQVSVYVPGKTDY